MSDCQELVRRTPTAIIETGARRDYTHTQRCGRPVVRDGLCAVHIRAEQREPSRERSRLRALLGRVRL